MDNHHTVSPAPGLSVCLGQREGAGHLEVHMDLHLDRLQHEGRPVELVLPGDEGVARSRIRNLEVEGASEGAAPRLGYTQEGRVLVHTGGQQHVRIRYTVHPVAERSSAQSRHAVVGHARRLYAPGHALLVQAPNLSWLPEASLTWSTGESCGLLPVASSIEPGITTLQRVLDAHFVSGTQWWRGAVPSAAGTLTVFADAEAVAAGRRVLEILPAILREQHPLTQPAPDTGVHVVILTTPPGTPATGAGRAGGFVLELPEDFDPRDLLLAELLAHENLHRVLGHTIYFHPSTHDRTLWFIEGVTEFLALQSLARLDPVYERRLLLALAQAADGVEYYGESHAPGWEQWTQTLRRSPAALRLPYDQGLLTAAWLMSRPRPEPLDWPTLLRTLSRHPQPLGEADLFATLRMWATLTEEEAEHLTSWVTPGALPDLEGLWARLGLRRVLDDIVPRPTNITRLSSPAVQGSASLHHATGLPTASLRAAAEHLVQRHVQRGVPSRLEPLPSSGWRQRLGVSQTASSPSQEGHAR